MNNRESGFQVPGQRSQDDSSRDVFVADIPAIEKGIEELIAHTKNFPEDVTIVSTSEMKDIREKMRRILRGLAVDADTVIDRLYFSERASCGIFLRIDDGSELGLPTVAHFEKNVRRMIALEKRCRGAVHFLHTERGISNFARYSVRFWKRQFKERASNVPYMVLVNPSDLEDDYLSETKVFSKFQDTLAELSTPHLMRMVEVENVPDILRQFVKLDKTYNANGKNPIAAVLYDGHGTGERVMINRGVRGGLLGPDQLNTARFAKIFRKHLAKAFAKSAQFILGSCEAGTEETYRRSVGFLLKDALREVHDLGVRVSASPYSILPFTSIHASLKDGMLAIDAHTRYHDEKTLRIHRHRLKDL